MPITINTQPASYNWINSPIETTVTATGLSTSTTEGHVIYRLVKALDDTPLTPWFKYDSTDGTPFKVSMASEIFALLYTPIPEISGPILELSSVPSMGQAYKIEFKDVIFNSETCISTESASVYTESFNVYNAAASYTNYYTESIDPNFNILNNKPTVLTRTRGYSDWLYLASGGPNTIVIGVTYYNSNGVAITAEGFSTLSLTDLVHKINVLKTSPAIADTLEYVVVTLYLEEDPSKKLDYTIRLKDKCSDSVQISYITRGGGYNTVSGKILKQGYSSNSDDTYRNPSDGMGGNMTANKNTFIEYDVQVYFDIVDIDRDNDVYDQLIAAGHYYMIVKGTDGLDRQISCTASNFDKDRVLGVVKMKLRHYLPIDQPNYYL
jgi:hypothetical protein